MTIGRKFGQSEPLTTRLHNLVRSYPKGLGILKEFIQNADDAEADEIVFVIDEYCHHGSGLPESMQWLYETPALLVYNNKPFTDSDIEGIQKIGDSGKSDSIGKTGRFGLGFNACYNVTDVPSFFTRNEVYFFDPHYQTLPGASVESPGRRFSADELSREGWPVLDWFSSLVGNGREFEGTVFRLPFRTPQQATISQIKREAYTVADALHAVQELQKLGSTMLLFLKHVKQLKVVRRKEDGSLVNQLSVRANNPIKIESSRSKVNSLLRHADPEQILIRLEDLGSTFSSCVHEYSVELYGDEHIESWRVVDGFFTDANHRIIDACREMNQNGEKAMPYAGAAWRLDSDRHPDGRLFCFLPVPMQTNLPVQINGYFDLDDSRQNMFLDRSADGSARRRFEWNKCLLQTSVAQAYVQLLSDLRSDVGTSKIESYYNAFPKAVEMDTGWEGWLTSALYLFASRVPLVRSSGDIRWRELKATRSLPNALASVRQKLLSDDFLPIPDPILPQQVRQGFELNGIVPPELTPYDLREVLREECDVNCELVAAPRACLRERSHLSQLIRFCLSDDPGDDIRGLPLVLDCRGYLRTIGLTAAPLYISNHRSDIDVFWGRPEMFVDPGFALDVDLNDVEDAGLSTMDSRAFVSELAGYVETEVGDDEPRLKRSNAGALTEAWLGPVFSRLLESDLDGLRSKLRDIPLVPDQSDILHPMGTSATPLLFRGSSELKQSLTDLSVPLCCLSLNRSDACIS